VCALTNISPKLKLPPPQQSQACEFVAATLRGELSAASFTQWSMNITGGSKIILVLS